MALCPRGRNVIHINIRQGQIGDRVMGFDIRKRYRLKWSGTEYDGMEVVMSACSLAELFELDRITQAFRDNNAEDDARSEALWRERVAIMAKYTHEWNLTDGDKPLPVSAEHYEQLSPGILHSILNAWLRTTTKVADPLPAGSPDGELFREGSIPMETLSSSQPS